MKEYTMKINLLEHEDKKLTELPQLPFMVRHIDGSRYLITQYDCHSTYKASSLATGKTYIKDYDKKTILDVINAGTWTLIPSEIRY